MQKVKGVGLKTIPGPLAKAALPVPRLGWREELWRLAVFSGLVLVNSPVVARYLGHGVALLYAAGMATVCFVGPWLSRRARAHGARLLVLGIGSSALAQAVGLSWLGPVFDAGMDRDSALIGWWSALAQGQFPYSVRTHLGNPISVLPVMPAVALPFVLLGNVGYLEVVSFLCLAALLWHHYSRSPRALVLSLAALCSAPLVFLEVIGRSDLLANMALLMLLLTWLEVNEHDLRGRRVLLLGGYLGCLLATRVAVFPSLVVVAIGLLRWAGPRAFAKAAAASSVVVGVLVLPFLLWDPLTFLTYAPLGVTSEKLGSDPLARIAWPMLAGCVVLATGLAMRGARNLFIAQVPVMATVVLATSLAFTVDLSYLQLVFVPLLFAFPLDEGQPAGPPAQARD